MDLVLCDDQIRDVLQRLPPFSRHPACLVCKRWHSLLCYSSATSLSLCIPLSLPSSAVATSLSSVVSHYPSLSNLTLRFSHRYHDHRTAVALLLDITASPCFRHLSYFSFLPDITSYPFAPAISHFIPFDIASFFHLSFHWLSSISRNSGLHPPRQDEKFLASRLSDDDECANNPADLVPLPLESLSLSGFFFDGLRLNWMWRRCSNLRSLRLSACIGTIDPPPSPTLPSCLSGLLSLELYFCFDITNHILLLAADHCRSLTSLVLYDYVWPDVLLQFFRRRGAGLRTLRLGLPFYLKDDHLSAIATNDGRSTSGVFDSQLTVLHLDCCNQITAKGLRSIALSPAGAGIKELALVHCDAIESEPGLLTLLVQSMPRLRMLNLSFNERLADKEIESMLEKCSRLVDIRLRGCSALTNSSLLSLLKHCGHQLQVVDITSCDGIQSNAIEKLVFNTGKLSQLIVEETKVSEAAKGMLSQKGIQIQTSAK